MHGPNMNDARCMRKLLSLIILLSLLSCNQPTQVAEKPAIVRKKIVTPAAPAPTVAGQPLSGAAVRGEGGAGSAPALTPPAKPADPAGPTEEKQAAKAAASAPDGANTSLPEDQFPPLYEPAGKIDPFAPLIGDNSGEAQAKKKKSKRVPQTPLERMDLSQLKLTAIIRSPNGNLALVEESNGKGYIVSKGTYIGLNSGMVYEILKDRLVVEEEVENVLGEVTVRKTELKLQKPAGEF